MSESQTIEQYSSLEEIFNSITHGIGALISIAGLVLLIVFSKCMGFESYYKLYNFWNYACFALHSINSLS